MKIILGWLGLERSGEISKRLKAIEQQQRKIMATQAEVAAQIQTLTASLQAANGKLSSINDKVIKIGTETDSLLTKIRDLEDAINNQSEASPALVAAFAALKEQADAQSTAIETLSTSAQAGDDKVTDDPTP